MSYFAEQIIFLIIALMSWAFAIAMMVIAIIFLVKVPRRLSGIEKQLQISNSLKVEQMHKEALKETDQSISN